MVISLIWSILAGPAVDHISGTHCISHPFYSKKCVGPQFKCFFRASVCLCLLSHNQGTITLWSSNVHAYFGCHVDVKQVTLVRESCFSDFGQRRLKGRHPGDQQSLHEAREGGDSVAILFLVNGISEISSWRGSVYSAPNVVPPSHSSW